MGYADQLNGGEIVSGVPAATARAVHVKDRDQDEIGGFFDARGRLTFFVDDNDVFSREERNGNA